MMRKRNSFWQIAMWKVFVLFVSLMARVAINRRTTNGRLNLSYEHSLFPGSFGSVLESDVITLRYRHRWSERLAGVVSLRALTSEDNGNPFSRQNRDYVQFSPELSWRMSENFRVSGGYRLRWNDRDVEPDDALSNAAFISLSYQPRSEI